MKREVFGPCFQLNGGSCQAGEVPVIWEAVTIGEQVPMDRAMGEAWPSGL